MEPCLVCWLEAISFELDSSLGAEHMSRDISVTA